MAPKPSSTAPRDPIFESRVEVATAELTAFVRSGGGAELDWCDTESVRCLATRGPDVLWTSRDKNLRLTYIAAMACAGAGYDLVQINHALVGLGAFDAVHDLALVIRGQSRTWRSVCVRSRRERQAWKEGLLDRMASHVPGMVHGLAREQKFVSAPRLQTISEEFAPSTEVGRQLRADFDKIITHLIAKV